MSFKYKVLSIDGGGIRGIVPAIILKEIEQRTQKRIWELFDLIAGTSTGGFLAMILTMPNPENPNTARYSMEEIINMYRKDGKNIFHEPFLESLTEVDDLLRPKYPSEGRQKIAEKYFQDAVLQDALTNIFITSYDIELRVPVFFINNSTFQRHSGTSFRKLCTDYKMIEAAMATSAAPTFFEPYKLAMRGCDDAGDYALVDGAMFANNPTALAIVEAIIYSQNHGEEIGLENILVASFGTGSLTRKFPYDEAVNWGKLQWLQPLINIFLDGASEVANYQLRQLLPDAQNIDKQYYRFQKELTEANDDLDNTTEENMKLLEKVAHTIISEQSRELDKLCEHLGA
ncbi:patatin [Rivularia sp. PCC 7116]|uniref:patatin-like phospholipase family protein n=1 Tax=Rivularia sp. PCC 7116 TaxID=373994 RepID=UPI00029EF137|nr:patatin-like phospholipase family protein [Rivularia sp. PCC 7116]AFY55348.1 patatin [Rivularia sp. PCC 7116]